ncbi:uncharacterized protein K452DRAFT_153347 [Aplosporella prunicola CBS 121167]|uniref:Uncharacterized protein n=1 Tax=Aplosporella prunicola CBS 121167 TaxID=1176127 RepID=A0A6A6BJ01_9PEZI|nr:uncharacterized protein K452DRAFT_153347 [Aplosporella prunicola CBS 121167]KAF2144120.1 hypothetical protein K452DRAFT_153347 [Aplosporella prunicola CBS 121167]
MGGPRPKDGRPTQTTHPSAVVGGSTSRHESCARLLERLCMCGMQSCWFLSFCFYLYEGATCVRQRKTGSRGACVCVACMYVCMWIRSVIQHPSAQHQRRKEWGVWGKASDEDVNVPT